jgi:hypothetical protein
MDIGTLNGSTVVAASQADGRTALSTEDAFVAAQSRFDRQARVCIRASVAEVTEAMYLDYVASQVMDWSADEITALTSIVAQLGPLLAPFDLSLPGEILLVKTTGQEEGHAAYTRQQNVIVLPVNMVQSLFLPSDFGDPLHSGTSPAYLTGVIIHELFHLFSKNNPVPRWALYDLVHYEPTGCDIALPDVSWPQPDSPDTLASLKVTNPDTPEIDTFIRMSVTDAGGGSVVKPLVPVLVATGAYDGGVFFDYLGWWFMAIVQAGGGWTAELDPQGRPFLYPSQPLLEQYLQLIGRNMSDELFHPDEILAQNWVLVAQQPSLDLLVGMRKTLTGQGRSTP